MRDTAASFSLFLQIVTNFNVFKQQLAEIFIRIPFRFPVADDAESQVRSGLLSDPHSCLSLLILSGYHHRNVARAFVDAVCPSSVRAAGTVSGRPFVDISFVITRLFGSSWIIVFRIGDGRIEQFFHDRRCRFRRMAQNRRSLRPPPCRGSDPSPAGLSAERCEHISQRRSRFLHACTSSPVGVKPHRFGYAVIFSGFLVVVGMSLERPGRRKFAELVADHVFRYIYRHVLASVIDGKRMSDKLRENGRTARPVLMTAFLFCCSALPLSSSSAHRQKGPFFRLRPILRSSLHHVRLIWVPSRRSIIRRPIADYRRLLRATANNIFVRSFVFLPGFETERRFTPRRHRRFASDRRLTFTTAVRVIVRVHAEPRTLGRLAEPAAASRFSDLDQFVVLVADRTDRGAACFQDAAHFARSQPDRLHSRLPCRAAALRCRLRGQADRLCRVSARCCE